MFLFLVCSRLLVSGDSRKSRWETGGISDEQDLYSTSCFSLPDVARCPPAFSIVPTDQETGTGYTLSRVIFIVLGLHFCALLHYAFEV